MGNVCMSRDVPVGEGCVCDGGFDFSYCEFVNGDLDRLLNWFC